MNNIITCEPVEINVTPYGFYMFANDYYNVARKASEISFGKRINYPAYFLYCRSIELTIKSVLLASKKYSLDEIKTHDFSKLLPKLDKSLLKILIIGNSDKQMLNNLDKWYKTDQRMFSFS